MIVGGGFAGLAVAQRLERTLRPGEAEIVLLSRENFTLFTPMLPEVTSGELEVRHVVTPIRTQVRRTRFVLAEVGAIDVEARTVTYRHVLTGIDVTLAYDQLVLALGSQTSTYGLPGVAENVWALKTLADADVLRNHLVWLLELADTIDDASRRKTLLTIVVVGGGFTGVETAGETADLFRSVVRFYTHLRLSDIRMILVEGGPALLANLPPKMGAYSRRMLERRGVEVVTGDPVASADRDGLTLKSGRRISTGTIVWSAGVAPSPTIAQLPLQKTRHGAVVVGPDMRVAERPEIWALGDCASIPDGKGGAYPATAQHAIREGPHLADNLASALRGGPTAPFRFEALGMMASLGGHRAVAQLPGDRVITGFLAWFLWRSYYLMRLPGLDRKLRVAFDWTIDLLFPRDISELRIFSDPAEEPAARP